MECFVINSREIEGTLGVEYYKPIYRTNKNKIKNSRYTYVKLETLCEVVTKGETPLWRGDSYQKAGILFIKSENVLENELVINDPVYISDNVHERMKRSQLKYGDALLNIVGASIGRSCVFNLRQEGNINQAVCLIRLKNNLNSFWLSYLLNSVFFQLILKQNQSGGARDNIDLYQVRELLVPIHPKDIQDRIVSLMDKAYSQKKPKEAEALKLLDSINDYVLDELGIKLPELKDKMTYVVNSDEAENKRIDAYYYQPKFEEVERAIKKGKFEVKKLKDIANKLLSGQRPKGGVRQISEGVLSLGGEHVLSDGIIATSDLKFIPKEFHEKQIKSKVQKKDIIIVKDGATTGKIGIVPENYPFEEANINEHVFLLRVKENINPYYIFSILKSQLGQIQINRDITGGTIMGIIRETTEVIKIPLPPLAVQNKIAEEVKKRMLKAEQLQKEAKEELVKAKQEVEKIILGDN